MKHHPATLGAAGLLAFLSHLALRHDVASSIQNQALSALHFLYRHVAKIPLPDADGVECAGEPGRVPVVLSGEYVRRVPAGLSGTTWRIASLLYGPRLRLTEGWRLRVKDLDLCGGCLHVRRGERAKDLMIALPRRPRAPLELHLAKVRNLRGKDLAAGHGRVALPDAPAGKYPNACRSRARQYDFRSRSLSAAPASGDLRRHHLAESTLQRAVARAVQQGRLSKRASCHTFRRSFATHLLADGYDTAPCRGCSATATRRRP